jgi:hypothetical protein
MVDPFYKVENPSTKILLNNSKILYLFDRIKRKFKEEKLDKIRYPNKFYNKKERIKSNKSIVNKKV